MIPPLHFLESLARWPLDGKALPLEPQPGGGSSSTGGSRPPHVDERHEDLWRACEAERRLRELERGGGGVHAAVLRCYFVTHAAGVRELPAVYAAIYLLSVGKRLPEAPPHPGPKPKPKAKGYPQWERLNGAWRGYQTKVLGWARGGAGVLCEAKRAWGEP